MNHFFPSGIQSRIKISIVAREEGESHVDERYDLVKIKPTESEAEH